MKNTRIWLVAILVLAMGCVNSVSAATLSIFENATYRDGTVEDSFDPLTVPNKWTATFNTPGDHFFGLFIDAEIDEPINTFYNEYGAVNGTPAAGLSWEIDEPWYGDIFFNFEDGLLDNTNEVPGSLPNDVAMALLWEFTLLPGEIAYLEFLFSEEVPTTDFYLSHVDPDSDGTPTLYFSTSLQIRPIPEPSTLLLCVLGLSGLGLVIRKR